MEVNTNQKNSTIFFKERGIKHEFTIAQTSMLQQGKMPPRFWAEAVYTAVDLRNRCPTTTAQGSVPYEVLYGNIPSVSYLRTFGCNVYVRIDNTSKFDAKAKRCRFVGYSSQKKGYRVYDIKTDIIEIHRDAKLMGSQFGNQEMQEYVPEKLIYQFSPYFESEDEIQQEIHENNPESEVDYEVAGQDVPNEEEKIDISELQQGTSYEEKFIRQVKDLPEKRQRKRPDKLNLLTHTESKEQLSFENSLNEWFSW